MIRSVLLFLSLLLTLSCARLELQTKGCEMPIPLAGTTVEATSDFEIQKTIHTPWAPLNEGSADLQEILEENNIRCPEVRKLEITFKSDAADSFLSVFPFLAHKTLLLKGKKITR